MCVPADVSYHSKKLHTPTKLHNQGPYQIGSLNVVMYTRVLRMGPGHMLVQGQHRVMCAPADVSYHSKKTTHSTPTYTTMERLNDVMQSDIDQEGIYLSISTDRTRDI
jgi:hypothetical protein